MSVIPPGTLFDTVFQAYLADQQDDNAVLWRKFLVANNLDANDARIAAQDDTLVAKFVRFVQSTYESKASQLSLDEMTRRHLIFTIYDLIILLLQAIQQNVGVLGENIVYLGKYQRAYAGIAGRLAEFFYIGGADSRPVPNNADLSKWTLGYGDVNIQDYLTAAIVGKASTVGSPPLSYDPLILQSVAAKLPATDPEGALKSYGRGILLNPFPGDILTSFLGGQSTLGQVTNQLAMKADDTSISFQFSYVKMNPPPEEDGDPPQFERITIPSETGYTSFAFTDPTLPFEKKLEEAKTFFQQFLNTSIPGAGLTVYQAINSTPETYGEDTFIRYLTIPWSNAYNLVYTPTGDDGDHARQSTAAGYRGDKNSLLQQYVQNIQTHKQIFGKQADAEQTTIQQAQTGLGQGSELLSSLIRQMSTILTAIFQIST